MKILHVLASPTFSGAENVACQIISMFKDTDIEMAYASPLGSIADALDERNITYFPMASFTHKELKKIINRFNPDLIHAHDMRASYVVAISKGKIPYISHIHNNNFNSRGLSIKSLAYLFASFYAKHIIWVSRTSYTGYKFHKYLENKSTILYNVIDINDLNKRESEAKDRESYDIIFLGRLTYPKNPLRLIEILNKVISYDKDLKAVIVGDGDLKSEVKKKIDSLGLKNNIVQKGFVENPLALLRNSKVMLMCSLWEGTPMCALESMALGTPIVSTPVDGLADIIKHEHNGFLAASDDELVSALLKITSDPEYAKKLSYNAKQDSYLINNIEDYQTKLSTIYKQ